VHAWIIVISLATSAYVGSMLDNLLAFATQLAVAPPMERRVLCGWQSAGVTLLVALALFASVLGRSIPVWAFGLLALAPWAAAVQRWRHQNRSIEPPRMHGGITALVIAVALGGDNLALWIPLFRAHNHYALAVIGTFAAWQCLFLFVAWSLAHHPAIRRVSERVSQRLMPWLYVVLGLLVLFECHTI